MNNEFPGYDHWKTSGPPDEPEDNEDNATILEGLRESVEEDHPDLTEKQVESVVAYLFSFREGGEEQ